MVAVQLNNNLGLAPPKAQPSIQRLDPPTESMVVDAEASTNRQINVSSGLQTEFAFELPTGYLDALGQIHRRGIMRLARTVDEIEPMSSPMLSLKHQLRKLAGILRKKK